MIDSKNYAGERVFLKLNTIRSSQLPVLKWKSWRDEHVLLRDKNTHELQCIKKQNNTRSFIPHPRRENI